MPTPSLGFSNGMLMYLALLARLQIPPNLHLGDDSEEALLENEGRSRLENVRIDLAQLLDARSGIKRPAASGIRLKEPNAAGVILSDPAQAATLDT